MTALTALIDEMFEELSDEIRGHQDDYPEIAGEYTRRMTELRAEIEERLEGFVNDFASEVDDLRDRLLDETDGNPTSWAEEDAEEEETAEAEIDREIQSA